MGVQDQYILYPDVINLIGDHTDYNGGFVFSGAIDQRSHGRDQIEWHTENVCLFN